MWCVNARRVWRVIVPICGAALIVLGAGQDRSPHWRPAAGQCPVLSSASRSVLGAAGQAPQRFALFRRPHTASDRLPPSHDRLANQIWYQLRSLDPTLIRAVTARPLERIKVVRLLSFVVVGQGAAPLFTLEGQSCARRLSPRERRQLQHGLALRRAITPAGPSFCFVTVRNLGTHLSYTDLDGICDTFANAATGYGANEIDYEVAALASIVPDDVATVVLRYAGHPAIQAPVTHNVYWVRVPRLPPLGGGPGAHALALKLRAFIRKQLPDEIDWLSSTGRTLRSFKPPPAYVRMLVRRYQACVELECGA